MVLGRRHRVVLGRRHLVGIEMVLGRQLPSAPWGASRSAGRSVAAQVHSRS